jgi:hypothetical protein
VYKFVTSKDFPNLGEYGMTDYSWKRGMVDTVEVYNSRNKLLSRDVSEYEYHEREISLPLLPLNSYYTQTHFENTSGWVKLKKTEKTVNGVKSSSTTLYANDLTVESADKDNSPPKKVSVFDANKKIMPYRYTPFLMDENDRVVVCKKTHSSEPTKEKIAIIKSDGTENIILCLGEYVNKDLATQSSNELWSEWQLYRELIDIGRCDVVGAEFLKMDANDDDDLVVVTNHRYQSSDIYLFVYVFHDIHINDITKQMEYHNNFGTVGRASFTRLDRKYDVVYKCPVGCVIGNFHGGAHPDFLILTHQYNSQPVYPGDLVPGQDRSIYAIMDFEERNPLDCIYTPTVYRSAVSYPYFGHSGFFTSLDNNGLKNDLVITGPGITTNAWLPKQTRPIV